MIENEDSVVTSLNELRKLKNERITRQSRSRGAGGAARAVALAEDPAAEQATPPPIQVEDVVSRRRSTGYETPAVASSAGSVRSDFASLQATYSPAPPVVQIQTRTSVKAAVVVSILLIGAGGAGYMKLQNDTQMILAAKDAAIRQAEDSRNKAVENAVRTDLQTRTSLRQCEDKLKANLAAAPVAAPAVTSSPAVAPVATPAASAKSSRASISHRSGARSSRHVASRDSARESTKESAAKSAKPADIPAIAKKKKLENDPLDGLGKP